MISFSTFFAITMGVAFLIVGIAGWLYLANDGFDVETTSRKAAAAIRASATKEKAE